MTDGALREGLTYVSRVSILQKHTFKARDGANIDELLKHSGILDVVDLALEELLPISGLSLAQLVHLSQMTSEVAASNVGSLALGYVADLGPMTLPISRLLQVLEDLPLTSLGQLGGRLGPGQAHPVPDEEGLSIFG